MAFFHDKSRQHFTMLPAFNMIKNRALFTIAYCLLPIAFRMANHQPAH